MATLLTGVGYLGAPLLRRLVERGERVVAFDNAFSTPRQDLQRALPAGVRLIEGDVAEGADVARAFDAAGEVGGGEPLLVYHLAAQPSAAVAVRQPALTERSNLVGARLLLEAARELGARVVFAGSFRVYGDDLDGQTVDEDTPYGKVGDLSHLSKVYVEQLARMIGAPFMSVRLGVAYGLSPIMKAVPAFMTVPNLFCQRAAQGELLEVIQDRPLAFIHVDDAVDALLLAADRLACGGRRWEAVNAAPEVATIGEVARLVQRLAQRRGQWVRVQGTSSAESPRFVVRSRLADEAGFRPRHTLADGLEPVYDYFLAADR